MAKKKVYSGDIADLQFDDMNFNRHTKRGLEMLGTSLERNGFGRSVLVDKDNRLIAGNGVTEKAMAAGGGKTIIVETDGTELVVVKRTDLTLDSKEGREMATADNAIAAVDLDWDEDMLREAADLYDVDFEQYGLDLDMDDDDLTDGTSVAQASEDYAEDDYDEDKDVAPKKAARGDLWLLGDHKLVCGDSTDQDTIARLMGEEKAELLLTDPPCNVAYSGTLTKKRDGIKNDAMGAEAFVTFLTRAWKVADACMNAGCSFYVWFSLSEYPNFVQSVASVEWKHSETLIWVKTNNFILGRLDYHMRHEPCLYGWKQGVAHHWYGDRKQTTVLEFPKPIKSVDHPTMKPVPLFSYVMCNSSKEGDVVLDLFGGSGTTLVAAEQTGRKARLSEYDEHYCDVILDRYIKLVGSSQRVYLLKEDGTKIPYKDVER